ncbi:hypothetical protein EXE42_14990 [Halorubrum sp. SP3]|nr:hypothetical protein EXE42_14990 [Halorubrum sp. SP3]
MTRLREESAILSNSKPAGVADGGSPVRGVSLCTVRGTTQSRVKVPKCRLSAIRRWSQALNSREVSLEAATR